MSGTPQKLTGYGKTPPIEAAGSGNERRVVDPELRDLLGNVIAPRTISVSDGFEVASIQDDPNLALFGTFTVQNRLSVEAQCKWEASHLHSIQKPARQAEQTTFGALGGGVEPPLPFAGGGGGAYTDNLLPRYGNPIPVASFQAALDANKRTIRTLVYRPNLPASTPPAPNTFTDWSDLYAAYQAQADAGACLIKFEQDSLFGAPIQIPAGVWDFTYGDVFSGASLGPPLSVELVDGCQIRNVFLFEEGLGLIGKTTGAPQLVWDQFIGTGAPTIVIFQDAVILRNEGTAPMISWAEDVGAGDLLGIGLGFFSRLEQGTYEVIDLPNVAGLTLCQFFCPAAAFIAANTLRGSGNAAYQFEINAQGGEINLDQPNFTGLGPLSNPASHLIRANRRIRFHESQTPLDNGATIDLEPSATALCAPSVNGGAAITINLPRAAFFAGIICGVKKINGDVSTAVNVIPQGGETINGAGSYSLPVGAYSGAQFFSDGQNWLILNTQIPLLGVNSVQLPDATGAFAYYPMQDAALGTQIDDVIGGRHLIATGTGIVRRMPHPLYFGRYLAYIFNAPFETAADPAWASPDTTIEMILRPASASTNLIFGLRNPSQCFDVSYAGLSGSGVFRYIHNTFVGITPAGNPDFGGPASPYYTQGEPILVRYERELVGGTYNIRIYTDGTLQSTLTTATVPPAATFARMEVSPGLVSDIIVWKTANPPVTAEQQARRVKPLIFS